jgi:HNH endonuclease
MNNVMPSDAAIVATTRITAERLREVANYNPESGQFTRLVSRGKWQAGSVMGCEDHGYIRISIDDVRYYAHQLAYLWMTGVIPPEIDHRDLDGLNNRWDNLRPTTDTLNRANQRTWNQLGVKGVHRNKKRFSASIQKEGSKQHLGTFDTPEEANAAYAKRAEELFGEFARAA